MKRFLMLTLIAVLVAVDQIIKQWALNVLEPIRRIPIIQGLFSLTYTENTGMALGLFQNKTIILSIISGTLLLIITYLLFSGKFKSSFLVWTISIALAGGFGNLYDRAFRGFVVDYLDFSSIGFPFIFNFADCCVVCSTILILIYCVRLDVNSKNKKISNEAEEENLHHEAD